MKTETDQKLPAVKSSPKKRLVEDSDNSLAKRRKLGIQSNLSEEDLEALQMEENFDTLIRHLGAKKAVEAILRVFPEENIVQLRKEIEDSFAFSVAGGSVEGEYELCPADADGERKYYRCIRCRDPEGIFKRECSASLQHFCHDKHKIPTALFASWLLKRLYEKYRNKKRKDNKSFPSGRVGAEKAAVKAEGNVKVEEQLQTHNPDQSIPRAARTERGQVDTSRLGYITKTMLGGNMYVGPRATEETVKQRLYGIRRFLYFFDPANRQEDFQYTPEQIIKVINNVDSEGWQQYFDEAFVKDSAAVQYNEACGIEDVFNLVHKYFHSDLDTGSKKRSLSADDDKKLDAIINLIAEVKRGAQSAMHKASAKKPDEDYEGLVRLPDLKTWLLACQEAEEEMFRYLTKVKDLGEKLSASDYLVLSSSVIGHYMFLMPTGRCEIEN